jgi:sulfite reductase (ferredoxin)
MNTTKSKVEVLKEESRQLRGTIAADLSADAPSVGDISRQLLKFHGLYEQDDRERRKQGAKSYSFMIRSKLPGGRLTPAQYLAHDELASRFGNGTLRITTRQDIQLHGVLKRDVKPSIAAMNRALVTTFGACGDVVRNVACCPLPATDALRVALVELASGISKRMMPRTQAYHEIWLDGELQHDGGDAANEEPIYGRGYLPRKFKIAVAYPGDNCVDVFTQDVGIVAIAERGALAGFNVLVGGGQGMTHNKPETFPRLGDAMAFVRPAEVIDVVEQIVCVQRDHGDRGNRRHARLKYLIHDRGVEWFRREVEARLGRTLAPPLPMPPFALELHLGWRRQSPGRWSLGIPVENGRIQDAGNVRLKSGVHAIVERFDKPVILTPNQDVLLTDIADGERAAIEEVLDRHGIVRDHELSQVRLHSMACPALPTCGLALADAERALPAVVRELEGEIARLGLGALRLTVRMTGCPNGCARPYVADIAFVGRSLDRYVVLVGGRSDGTRLNRAYRDLVPRRELVATVLPLLVRYKQSRAEGESFGDFCDRVGIEALQAYAEAHGGVTVHD